MRYTVQDIAELIHAVFLAEYQSEKVFIDTLAIDSRNIKNNRETIFFAIIGARNNGHRYIDDLYKSGFRNFVISDESHYHKKYEQANFLLVKDTLKALQLLASEHRNRFNFPVVGITGSNGKTVVKEWLFQLLHTDYHIVKSPKSYNSQVGVPLSVWQINEFNNFGIFEAGISLPYEMQNLAEIIRPQIGIFTNIGEAHAENFVNLTQKIEEKIKLFQQSEILIYCKDYDELNNQLRKSSLLKNTSFFTWSRKHNADLLVVKAEKDRQETNLKAIYKNNFIEITIPFVDEASIENAIHCWCLMLYLNYDNLTIGQRMNLLSPVAMRLEMKQGINNCSVINDSYNSDIDSLSIALDFLNQQNQHNQKTLILSDILQSGKQEEKLYEEVAAMCKDKGVSRLIGIGEALCNNAALFPENSKFYKSTEDFIEQISISSFKDETILLKGARTFKFEQISKLLQQKTHQTILEINLNALVANINYFKTYLHPETKVMAMVKAFSYGSGSFEIANILQYNRIDYLAVAYSDEGVELRKAGIKLPIMVMNPEVQSFYNMIQYNLEPEIYSFKILKEYSDFIKKNTKEKVAIHIKLDSGMHRLGFELNDMNELCVRLKNNHQLEVKSVFSHLAASDEKDHDDFTIQQINNYTEMCQTLEKHLKYKFIKHILNSSGVLRFKNYQFDMVRLGIGMHGLADSNNQSLIPTVQLKTVISQIKNLQAGESIGYSRKGRALKSMKIATVPIGYADGYTRKLGNGVGVMMINGMPAPTIGNICMDMTMLDITKIQAQEGDEVIVFGEEYSIVQLAKAAETIPYEILSCLSSRIKRVYYHE